MNDRRTEQTLYRLGLAAILVVAAAAFFIKVFEIPLGGPLLACPLYSLTDFSVPAAAEREPFVCSSREGSLRV